MEPTTTLKENLEKSSPTKIIPPSYNHIELTDEEQAEALRIARREKERIIVSNDYNRKVDQDDKPPVMQWDGYYKFVIARAAKLLTDQNKPPELFTGDGRNDVYIEICKYFTDDPSSTLDSKKGILMMGNIGCGKSFFLKVCSNNPRRSFHIKDCVKLPEDYSERDDHNRVYGEKLITQFRAALGPKAFDPWKHQYCGVLFDDLGWEENLKHFGNEINIMEKIFSAIYSANLPFSNYHATTNLTAAEIEKRYGSRIASRMREMFNQIVLPGKDLRA